MGSFRKKIKNSKSFQDLDKKIQKLDEDLKKTGVTVNSSDNSFLSENYFPLDKESNLKNILEENSSGENIIEEYREEVRKKNQRLFQVEQSIETVKYQEAHNIFKELYQNQVEEVVEKYVSSHSKEIVSLREDLFVELGKRPAVDLSSLEEKIDLLAIKYRKLSEGLLNDPTRNSDPLSQSPITLEQLKNHYQLLVGRLQEQLATLGGGGEVRLRYLDDIVGIATNPSIYDGKYLKYDHPQGKFIFDTIVDASSIGAGGTWATDSVGINTIKNIGIGTTAKSGYKLYVEGNTRITGILTIGQGTITLDGNSNIGNIGVGITLYGNSGIISATAFYANGVPIGAQGIQGVQGIQGNQGSQGTNGTNGSQGAQGIQGTTGSGSQGVQGISGSQGTNGTSGSQGAQGIQGTTGSGSQGVQGISGSQGTTGTQGIQGIQGTTGSGSQGVQGISGSQGLSGAQGISGSSLGIKTDSGSVGSAITLIHFSGPGVTTAYFDNSGIATVYFQGSSSQTGTSLVGIATTATSYFNQLIVSGITTFQDDIYLGNDDRITFGGSNDFQIYHDGANAYLADVGSGNLYIRGTSSINLQNSAGIETYARFNVDGASEIYYDNSKKIETIGAGVTILGTLFTNQLGVSGVSTFSQSVNSKNLNVDTLLNVTGSSELNSINASGMVTSYQLNVTNTSTFSDTVSVTGTNNINFNDSNLSISHNGTKGRILNFVGNILISSGESTSVVLGKGDPDSTGDTLAKFTHQGANEFYYNNSKKIETTGYGATVYGVLETQSITSQYLDVTNEFTATIVGIGGTINSSFALNVVGTTQSQQLTVSGITTTARLNVGTGGTVVTTSIGGLVGIATTNPQTTFQVERYGVLTGFGTFSASVGITTDIDSFSISTRDFKTSEYTLYFVYGSNIQSQKILVMQDGTTAYSQEYAIMYNPAPIVSVGATMSGTTLKLQVTPETGVTGLTTYRFIRQSIL